jgi:TRAP-type C4-dicarboxylate transport system permease small subunit
MIRNMLQPLTGRLSTWMEILAGAALIGVMLLIGLDIVCRIFGHPIPGAYEIVSFAGGLVIGLALPATSRANGHVSTDLLLEKLPGRARFFLVVMTRLIGIAIFLLAGYGMIMMGIRLKAAGETTAVLSLPFYYVIYAVGGAFWVQALVLLSEIAGSRETPNAES